MLSRGRWPYWVGLLLLVLLTANLSLSAWHDHSCTVCRALQEAGFAQPAPQAAATPFLGIAEVLPLEDESGAAWLFELPSVSRAPPA